MCWVDRKLARRQQVVEGSFGPANKVAPLQPLEALSSEGDGGAVQLVTEWEGLCLEHGGVVQPPAQDQEQPHEREAH